MAESDISRTSYRGVQRVEVNRGPIDLDAAVKTVADSGHTYLPLVAPGPAPSVFVPPSPSPPTPTETELRQRLAVALDAAEQADDRHALAQSAHDRAEAHRQRCETALHSYDGLEDAIAKETIEQLVAETARVELSVAMHSRIVEREGARASGSPHRCVPSRRCNAISSRRVRRRPRSRAGSIC